MTLVIVFRASRNNRSAADYYAAGRSLTGPQNGFAIAGDYLSAASFLGIVGAIAVNGYDGFLYSVGFLVAWLVALLLVAELMRFYTVPTAKEARRSVVWAIWLIGIFYLFTLVLGFGAAAMVGSETIVNAPGGVNSAAPLLAAVLGGPILLGIISAVAFATILAVVAGLTSTAAASFAHDIYSNVIRKGEVDSKAEVTVARRTVLVIGAVSIIGGLITCVLLITFSPVVSGSETAMLGAGVDFAIFPLSNPGVVSIPLGFLLGWIGSITDRGTESKKLAAEMEVRSLTGHGAEKAVEH